MNRPENRIESTLLRRINERRLIEVIQQQGPSSRATLTRASGLTAPTVSKAVDSLLKRGLVEELDPVVPALGRPGRLVRMAADTAAVVGIVIDATTCCLVITGLEGRVTEEKTRRFPTPPTYARLLDLLARECRSLLEATTATPLGALSMPTLSAPPSAAPVLPLPASVLTTASGSSGARESARRRASPALGTSRRAASSAAV